jgi:ABC-type transporter Mla MlaB component
MEFKSTAQQDGSTLRLKFSGSIDEDTQFPVVNPGASSTVEIDLNEIKAINSVGIRGWLDWIRPVAEKSQIRLVNCPKAMVFQFNMVNGFLPPGTVVQSFYVPFFCEKYDREENILFTVGKEVIVNGTELKIEVDARKAAGVTEPDCELEMDVTEAKYFQFLKRA